MPIWKTVVIGVDGSKFSESALNVAIQMAICQKAKLIVANVYATPTVLTFLPPYTPQVPSEYSSLVAPLLKKYEELAKSAGVQTVETKVIAAWSNAGGALISEAEKYEDSVIVIGTKGLTGLKGMVLGSVAEYVAKNSDKDVVITKH
jgi:nucleotide-binding universal stress UspA family protein